jgi:hypothetical protein
MNTYGKAAANLSINLPKMVYSKRTMTFYLANKVVVDLPQTFDSHI